MEPYCRPAERPSHCYLTGMKLITAILSGALLLGIPAMADEAKKDMKDAGSDAKQAGKDAGRAAKHAGKGAARAGKKGVNKAAGATEKGADKVKEKTQ